MAKHAKICTKNKNGTWKYKCSCGKVKKDSIKFESSVDVIHAAHVKSESRYIRLN